MSYIEGFVLAVPAANKDKYREHASAAAPFFMRLGATRFIENWGDEVPHGKQTDFYRATKLEDGEVPLFSWIEYPDRATRLAAGKAMMDEPDMMAMAGTMPFDGQRMIYGGFETLNDTGSNGKPGYVEGMVSPVPVANKAAYTKACQEQAPLLIEHGALRVLDSWGDDVPPGKTTDYQRAVDSRDGETIGFSFIEWPSKQVRDTAWQALMEDPRMAQGNDIWDAKRSIFGGFVPVVDV